ncbi:UNVERIFIED_CONTAM: hypothetical protein K2H54_010372 [Gekko kuhli]
MGRACSVFGMIKYGRIHASNLLLALHTLGILVTSEEMHHVLRLINVDGNLEISSQDTGSGIFSALAT